MAAALPNRVTLDEYLAYDLAHEGRHEWVNGEIVAMAGASEAHGIIVSNLGSHLRAALAARPCRVFYSDLRVAIEATDLYTYPDITVTCGERKFLPTNPPTLVNPMLVVEVLSAGTAAYDRGAKAAHYRRCSSLKSLVLVDSERRHVEVFDRDGDGWRLVEAGGSASIALACIDARIELDAIYDGTELVT